MKKIATSIIFIFTVVLLYSGTVKAQDSTNKLETSGFNAPEEESVFDGYLKSYYAQVFGLDITQILNMDLYNSIEKWLGTPYRYAGKSLEGIDCSAFVNKVYETAYCYLLTGNSADLFKQVTHLPKDKLQEGDLVFFKINRKTISHVGVYLGGNKFAHASRSRGVIVSDLESPYYKKYFVKGGRVNFHAN